VRGGRISRARRGSVTVRGRVSRARRGRVTGVRGRVTRARRGRVLAVARGGRVTTGRRVAGSGVWVIATLGWVAICALGGRIAGGGVTVPLGWWCSPPSMRRLLVGHFLFLSTRAAHRELEWAVIECKLDEMSPRGSQNYILSTKSGAALRWKNGAVETKALRWNSVMQSLAGRQADSRQTDKQAGGQATETHRQARQAGRPAGKQEGRHRQARQFSSSPHPEHEHRGQLCPSGILDVPALCAQAGRWLIALCSGVVGRERAWAHMGASPRRQPLRQ